MTESNISELIRNIPHATVGKVTDLVAYEAGKVISRSLAATPGCKMTVFAIDEGEGMSSHTAPGDAFAFVLEGTAQITLDGTPHTIHAGESLVMSKGAPHTVLGLSPFKMLLVVVLP